jgi:hypothetical protein
MLIDGEGTNDFEAEPDSEDVGTGVFVGGGVMVFEMVDVTSFVGVDEFVGVGVGGGVIDPVVLSVALASFVAICVGVMVGGGVMEPVTDDEDDTDSLTSDVALGVTEGNDEGVSERERISVMDDEILSHNVSEPETDLGLVRLSPLRFLVNVFVYVAKSGVGDFVADLVPVTVNLSVDVRVSKMDRLSVSSSLMVAVTCVTSVFVGLCEGPDLVRDASSETDTVGVLVSISENVEEFVGVGIGGSVMVCVGDSMSDRVVVTVLVSVSSSVAVGVSVGDVERSRVAEWVCENGDRVTLCVLLMVCVNVRVSDPVLACWLIVNDWEIVTTSECVGDIVVETVIVSVNSSVGLRIEDDGESDLVLLGSAEGDELGSSENEFVSEVVGTCVRDSVSTSDFVREGVVSGVRLRLSVMVCVPLDVGVADAERVCDSVWRRVILSVTSFVEDLLSEDSDDREP